MTKRIAQAIVSLIALLAFVVIGAQIVGDFRAWECTCVHVECESCTERFTWETFHADALIEYEHEFTKLFNSYSYKLSKNGRSMIDGKFVKMS